MSICVFFFFFNDTATTEIYTLSLHDALPIFGLFTGDEEIGSPEGREVIESVAREARAVFNSEPGRPSGGIVDRKSTRLNSSHANISYAVFCLKKKKNQ